MRDRTGGRRDGSSCTGFASYTHDGVRVSTRRGRTVKVNVPSGPEANIFQDRTKTLIMKFPFLCAVCLILALIAVLAGCSSTPSSPGTITLPSAGTSGNLSRFVLSPAEVPFTAVAEKNQVLDVSQPSFSQFGAIQGLTQFYINQKTVSPTSLQLGQTIVQYPPGKNEQAFAAFEQESQSADRSLFNVSVFTIVPGIGNQSIAMVVVNRTDSSNNMVMIAFTKSDFMESVFMVGRKLDTDALTRAARLAASKIP